MAEVALGLGADVPLFLVGGTLVMSGIGEVLDPKPPIEGLAFAVVVPEFRLDTAEVYRAWDRLEGPVGEALPDRSLPPALRGGMPLRNDLLPAAIAVEPMLAEFMAEVRDRWSQPVALTGTGSGCFGVFNALDEASDAAATVADLCSDALGTVPRPRGVARMSEGDESANG
jgi:4-diphosphocytidyl-2-C-methyl-D-erythritol kinase